MYRVRAEAVSGKNVLANGKWLTCIGNKNVHVGDLIWTDGRCVYGNFKEAQQPLVITAPVEDDEGIPIFLDSSPYLYTYKRKLKEIEEGPVILKNKSGDLTINTAHNIINDYKDIAYKVPWRNYSSPWHAQTHRIITSNINKSGDIYTIHVKLHEDFHFAQIFKNENLISTFNTQEFANQEKIYVTNTIRSLVSQTGGELDYDDLSSNPTYGYIGWGFIEDENNWALMFRTSCSMTEGVSKYLGQGRRDLTLSRQPLSIYQTGQVAARSETIYLITKNESGTNMIELFNIQATYGGLTREEWMSPTGDVWDDPWITHIAPEINLGNSHSIGSVPNAIIPLQDGYYYTIINSPTPNIPFYFSFPASRVLNISLFNPQGIQIIEMKIHFYDYITITKIRAGKYLLGIYSSFNLVDEEFRDYFSNCIKPGLYICENKTLTKLKSGNCLNHRLRRMKKIKNWHKRIRAIPLEI